MAFNWIKTRGGDGNGIFKNAQGNTNALGVMGRIGAGLITAGASEGVIAGANAVQNDKYRVGGINLKPKLNPRKAMVDMLAKDYKMLESDPNQLGITQAQKQSMVDDSTRQAQAQLASQNQQLAQMALGGQGFQQGAFTEAQQGASKKTQDVAASASAQAEALHLAKIEEARQRIIGGLNAERMTRRQNRQYWANYGLSAGTTLASTFFNPGGLLNGGGNQTQQSAPVTIPQQTVANTAGTNAYNDPSMMMS